MNAWGYDLVSAAGTEAISWFQSEYDTSVIGKHHDRLV